MGAFAANPHLKGPLEIEILFIVLGFAAIGGDTVNYSIGKFFGPKVFQYEGNRFFKREHLQKTHEFYEKYGGKTIILARFMPIIRTFAPFVAGIGLMHYGKFILYNIVGGLSWIALCLFGGYYFGNIPVVTENFTLVIMAIVIVSILPGVFEYLRHRSSAKS